jgi:hypothetical protein
MLDTKERAGLSPRPAPPQGHAGKREHAENGTARRRLQHLIAARQLGDEIRLRLFHMEEHLAASGVGIEDFSAKEQVKELVRDLNLLIEAGGDVGLLRTAVEPHVRAAAIDFRRERDRRRRGRSS